MGVFRRRLNVHVQLPTGCGVPKPVALPNSVPHGNAALGMEEDQPVDFPGSRMFPAEAEEPPGQVEEGGWTRRDGQLRQILPLEFDSSPRCPVFFGIGSAFMTEWRQNSVLI
jgi:hypothetical protein